MASKAVPEAREGCAAAFLAQIPNAPTKARREGVRGREVANPQAAIRDAPIRNPRNPWPSPNS
eukprot:7136968-Alexandrium_andersonii.AAC.1